MLQGKSKQAIHAINKGFSIIQELNRSDPKNTDYQLDTSIIMSLYGRFEEKEKNYSAAYAWHMQELKIVLEIYAGNENNAEILSNLAETYLNLYKTASNLEKRLEAEQWCRKYLETQKKFKEAIEQYTKVKEKYPMSDEGRDIEKYISRATAQL